MKNGQLIKMSFCGKVNRMLSISYKESAAKRKEKKTQRKSRNKERKKDRKTDGVRTEREQKNKGDKNCHKSCSACA